MKKSLLQSAFTLFSVLLLMFYSSCNQSDKEADFGDAAATITLEVSKADMIRSLAGYRMDETLEQVLKETRRQQPFTNEDYFSLFEETYERMGNGKSLVVYFNPNDFETGFTINSSTGQVVNALRYESDKIVNRILEIISDRIERSGIAKYRMKRLETNSDYMLLELSTARNMDRIINFIQNQGKLEFWATYMASEIDRQNFRFIDLYMADLILSRESDSASVHEVADADTNVQITMDMAATESTTIGLFEMLHFTDIENRPLRSDRPELARVHLKDTAKVDRILNMAARLGLLKSDVRFKWGAKPIRRDARQGNEPMDYIYLYGIKTPDGQPLLGGEAIKTARQDFDADNASAYITMTTTSKARAKWARITANNIDKPIAIVVDNRVYSAPIVKNEIRGGSSVITGDFTVQEAQDLAAILNSGRLPCSVRVLNVDVK